tara:strand:- start:819 stop:923 length:105 start_codon:yes stop_codon:yes gene_type:complete
MLKVANIEKNIQQLLKTDELVKLDIEKDAPVTPN